jgi:uncharacterized SAM-binding protein YcdF (DUF218 family)
MSNVAECADAHPVHSGQRLLMFTLSKIIGFLVLPSSLAVMATVAGLLLQSRGSRPRLARRLTWGGVLLLAIAGIVPAGNWLILPLEQRFAGVAQPQPGDRIDGIIILGGFEDGWVTAGRGHLTINEAGERLSEGVRLARMFPAARVVFSGGAGTVFRPGAEATTSVADYFRDMGIGAGRVVLEGASRNTHENALFMADLLRPRDAERWILITSAYHMPRSVGLMRASGFAVVPYPVDFRTRDAGDALRLFESIPAGLQRLDLAAKEWLGLVSYRLLGRTGELLPGP